MPLPRLLLPLCGLLLALAVTAATAEAPSYESGEVSFFTQSDFPTTTWDTQYRVCSLRGGSLVPMSTELVYRLSKQALDKAGVSTTVGYMGGSTLMSSSKCTSAMPSLDCVWYWDQGRYSGAENAVAFYKGNRDSTALSGAGMMTTTVKSHWRESSDGTRCPCWKMQRYGAVLRHNDGYLYWSDADRTQYGYDAPSGTRHYRICLIDWAITTTTTKAPVTSGVANRPLVVSLPVAVALAVMAVVAWL